MKVSVIIPCYNERDTIEEILKAVGASPVDKEVIVVDDCSTDGTSALLRDRPDLYDSLLRHPINRGKGAALATGVSVASGDVIIIQDADLEYDPREYGSLLQPIIENKADVVYGSRFQGHGPHRVLYFWHSLGNKVLTLTSNAFSNLNLTDMETCYKVFRREVIQAITIEEARFGFEPEITAKIAKLPNVRIYEVGINYYGRTYREGKKIGWKDGIRAFYCIIKYNLAR